MRTRLAFKQLKLNAAEFDETNSDGEIHVKALGIAQGKIADKAVTLGKMSDFSNTDHLLIGDPANSGACIEGQIQPRHLSSNAAHSVYTAITGLGVQSQNMDFNSASKLTNLVDGATGSQDSCTVAQMEAEINSIQLGLYWKDSVRCASTDQDANIIPNGFATTVDGITVVDGDRVLLMFQDDSSGAAATEAGLNGIWIARAAAWERALDFNELSDNLSAAAVWVREGTKNGDKGFTQTKDAMSQISAGSYAAGAPMDADSSQSWVQFSGLGQITFPANAGLEKPGGNAGQIGIAARGILADMVASNRALIAPAGGMTAAMSAAVQATIELDGAGGEETLVFDDGMVASSAALYLNGVLLRYDSNAALPNGDYCIVKNGSSDKADVTIKTDLTSPGDKVEIRWITA